MSVTINTQGPITEIIFTGQQPGWAKPPTRDNFLFDSDIKEISEKLQEAIQKEPTAIHFRSVGRNFCSGGNAAYLKDCLIAERPEDRDIKGAMTYIRQAYELCQLIATSPVPIVTLLHGETIGLGAEIACASSHIIALPGSTFSVPQLYMGLLMLSIPQLVEKVGPGLAFFILTSSPVQRPLTTTDMRSMGLLEAEVPDLQAAQTFTEKLIHGGRKAKKIDEYKTLSKTLDDAKIRRALSYSIYELGMPQWMSLLNQRILGSGEKPGIQNKKALELALQLISGEITPTSDWLNTHMPEVLRDPSVFEFLRKNS